METNKLKLQYIMSTAKDICEYMDEHFCVEPDVYHIAELININLGFLFDFKRGKDNEHINDQ